MFNWSEWSECSTECIKTRFRVCPDITDKDTAYATEFDCSDGPVQKEDCSQDLFQKIKNYITSNALIREEHY